MRITQHTVFLNDIMRSVTSGNALPAGMQRSYVWTEEDVLAFCDSLSSRFPVGGLLTWKPPLGLLPQSLGKSRLGPIAPSNEGTVNKLILDGQNRLATLAWIHSGHEIAADTSDASKPERDTWLAGRVLVYDWTSQSFRFLPSEEAEARLTMPANAVFYTGTRMLREAWDRWTQYGHAETEMNAFLEDWDRISRGFVESQVVETCLEDATPDEARHAFLRICRTGVPMSEADFDAALAWLPASD